MIAISNYNIFRSDRCFRRGGGVAVYTRLDMACVDISSSYNSIDGIDFITLDISSHNILLVCLYVPPSVSSEILAAVRSLLTDILDSFLLIRPFYHQVVAGDFNHLNADDLRKDLGLHDLVTQPTRMDSILDHILMSRDLADSYDTRRVIYDCPLASADHKMITCVPNNVNAQTQAVRFYTVCDFRESNLQHLLFRASLVDWDSVVGENENVNSSWSAFHLSLKQLLHECIPKRTVSITHRDKEWMTPLTKILIEDKWSAFRSRNWSKYNQLKSKVRQEVAKAKQIWADKLMNTTNGLWKLVKQTNKKTHSDPVLLLTSTCQLSEDELNQLLTSTLISHFERPTDSKSLPDHVLDNDNWVPCITESQVRKMILRIPRNKAAGSDEIPTRIYRELVDFISKPLSLIFDSSCKQRRFPDAWKQGIIVPIPKTNPPDLKKLRFVTLLPLPSKILERIIFDNLRDHFYKSYGPEQHGFRQDASTASALLHLLDSALQVYDNCSNAGVAILSYDLSSAFDCLDHNLALEKMQQLNFPKGFIMWLASYLNNRTAIVRLQSTAQRSIPIERGVPQGSVLGPPVFNTYINSLCAKSEDVATVKYADDLSLVVPLKRDSVDFIAQRINVETEHVSNWCLENHLTLNASKSKCLLLTRSNVSNVTANLECVQSMKLLGLFINNKLNWNTHIDYLRTTCSKRLHILRRLRGLVPTSSLHKVYEALIRSLLDYSCSAFVGLNKKQSNILQRIQRRADKITRIEPSDTPLSKTSVADRRHELCVRLWRKIEKNKSHILHSLIPHRLPRSGQYSLPVYRTDKYGNSFFPYMSRLLNSRAP